MVEVHLEADDESMTLQENTDESYQLTIKSVTMVRYLKYAVIMPVYFIRFKIKSCS